jgi:hypothetical protein
LAALSVERSEGLLERVGGSEGADLAALSVERSEGSKVCSGMTGFAAEEAVTEAGEIFVLHEKRSLQVSASDRNKFRLSASE